MTARAKSGLTVDFGVRWHNYQDGNEYDTFGYTLDDARAVVVNLAGIEKNDVVRPVAVVVCERTPTRIMEVE